MIRIVRPPDPEIIRIQEAESAFYWSGCAEAFLRRNGIVNVETDRSGGGGIDIVCRGADWTALADSAALLEGPLSDATLRSLGLSATLHQAENVPMRRNGAGLAPLGYPAYRTRALVAFGEKRPEPKPAGTADRRWTNRTVSFQTFSPSSGWETFLEAQLPDGSWAPAGLRRGALIVLGIPQLDVICSEYAFPPLEEGYWDRQTGSVQSSEQWLVDSLASLAVEAKQPLVRVEAWPDGNSWALSVRHDWDRGIDPLRLGRLLSLYRRLSIRASFGVIAGNTGRRQMHRVIDDGHEVNLHAVAGNPLDFAADVTSLERLGGQAVSGYHCHGGAGSVGYLGDRQFGWAEALGLDYVEMLGRRPSVPTPIVRLDGHIPVPSRLVAPATHLSLDAGTKAKDHNFDAVAAAAGRLVASSGHAVVMNHPDVHFRELRRLLEGLDLSQCWRCTLEQAARWWRASHMTCRVVEVEAGFRLIVDEPLAHDLGIAVESGGKSRRYLMKAGEREIALPSDATMPHGELAASN